MSDDVLIERMARAICAASGELWREGTYEVASGPNFEMEDHSADPLNNHWRYKARAALTASRSYSDEMRDASKRGIPMIFYDGSIVERRMEMLADLIERNPAQSVFSIQNALQLARDLRAALNGQRVAGRLTVWSLTGERHGQ